MLKIDELNADNSTKMYLDKINTKMYLVTINILLDTYAPFKRINTSWNLKPHQKISKKNCVPKSILHVIKHVYFQLYTAHCDGVIWTKSTINNKYIHKQVWLFINHNASTQCCEENY